MINRTQLAIYCKGEGIEIGAYHNPFPAHPFMKVTYIDKKPYNDLIKMRDADPNLGPKIPIQRVDLVDDGQWLKKIPDNSQEFVISSHQIEHVQCPITAVENHVRVLRKKGVAIYAIPDKRYTFDRDREITTYGHLLVDYNLSKNGSYDISRLCEHYDDYLTHVDKIQDPKQRESITLDRISKDEDVHFHAWDAKTILGTFNRMSDLLHFELELFVHSGHENFIVIRKL